MRRKVLIRVLAILALTGFAVFACVGPRDHGNFSQFAGWAEWYAGNPPLSTPADAAERALLERYRPRFFLAPDAEGPIDFYRDYIAQGRLRAGSGAVVSEQVTRALLNAHKRDPRAVFVHVPRPGAATRATSYARLDRADVDLGEAGMRRFTFLTYHLVFRRSGLPAGLDGLREFAVSLVADPADWHQLDHYTAASIVLDEAERPIALMLQQHNNLRTHVFFETAPLPRDCRAEVDVAIRSNELFAHAPERRRRRAVDFTTPDKLRYLIGFAAAPWNAADDITEGARELDYALEFLPPDDAFYTFQGYLGARRVLPGRDGPPGADYNTLPTLKPLGWQLLSGYWREGNRGDADRLEASWARSGNPLDFIRGQAPVFAAALAQARPPAAQAC